MTQDEAAEADAIADLVNAITVRRMDPERFHVERDQIAVRLRRLASRLRNGAPAKHTTSWRSDDRAEPPGTPRARARRAEDLFAPASGSRLVG